MFKKLIPLPVVFIAIFILLPAHVMAFTGGAVLRVMVNGKLAARVENQQIEGSLPYIPVRVVCERLNAQVRWDSTKNHALVTSNGKTHTLTGIIRNGKLMAPAGTVAEIFNLNACYEPPLNTVSLNSGSVPTSVQLRRMLAPSDKYHPDDIYWLSRIVEAEARGEDYDSRLAVANVVLNRKSSGQYPVTVKEVIFDRKHGIQFTPVANGAVYNEPSSLSFLAALDALDGYNNVPGALFFMDPDQAQTLWIEDNREMAFTVGAHTYYY